MITINRSAPKKVRIFGCPRPLIFPLRKSIIEMDTKANNTNPSLKVYTKILRNGKDAVRRSPTEVRWSLPKANSWDAAQTERAPNHIFKFSLEFLYTF